ncbi:MAG: anthrone oxygenase family protein [Pseudomonadota bacterium]
MRSRALIGGAGGIEAMQVIDREVFRWVFMALFLGMAAISVSVAGYGAFGLSGPAGTLIMVAGRVYLIGCFSVAVGFNAPMNEAPAGIETSSGATRDDLLQTDVPRWTFWNSVPTFARAVAAALLLFGLLWMTQNQAQPV